MTPTQRSRLLRWPLWSWRNLAITAVGLLMVLAVLGRLTDGSGGGGSAADSSATSSGTAATVPALPSQTTTPPPTTTAPPPAQGPVTDVAPNSPPMMIATAFAAEWSAAQRPAASWLKGMSTYAAPSLMAQLQGVDPAQVPATRVIGAGSFARLTPQDAVVRIGTDGGRIEMTLVKTSGVWKVTGVAPTDQAPGAATPALTRSSETASRV